MKNETQRNRNSSFKLIWLPRSVIAQNVSSEGVNSLRSLSSSLHLLSSTLTISFRVARLGVLEEILVGFFCGIALVWSLLAVVYFHLTYDPDPGRVGCLP
jgi:hypothetical protein